MTAAAQSAPRPPSPLIALAATPLAFLLPSRSPHVSAGKLALINTVFAVFFLFTAEYQFPGGAIQITRWAEAIVHGTTLRSGIAQKDVGVPLLYIFSGFTIFHSFIGITLVQAAFGILMPVLVFYALVRASPTVAYYAGIALTLSLAPVLYIKWLYHDQSYIFFNLLAITLMVAFLWSRRPRTLYFFTLAALAGSFTRAAGNLMYPVLMAVALVTVRRPIRHFVGAALIFVAGVGLYQWHRYEIFDMRNRPHIPSGIGFQVLYGTYVSMGDFGVKLSPDIGPNTKRLLEKLKEELGPTTRESALIKHALLDDPPDFMEKYVYAYTPDELYEKIIDEPNQEYFSILSLVDPGNDGFLLKVALEIDRAHPWYVVQYSARNVYHAIFEPGYLTPRYSVAGYSPTGLDFIPGMRGFGVRSEDSAAIYGPRAVRELQYFPLAVQPSVVKRAFSWVRWIWTTGYKGYVWTTSALIVLAWVGGLAGLLSLLFPRTRFGRAMAGSGVTKLTPPIVATTALLLYEVAVTSLFAEPSHRYFHNTEPVRMIIAGLGVAFVIHALSYLLRRKDGTRARCRAPALLPRSRSTTSSRATSARGARNGLSRLSPSRRSCSCGGAPPCSIRPRLMLCGRSRKRRTCSAWPT